ncbi:MAG: hypothetical protein IT334_10045 [Thermomicrobiales bacterium]|nr:hypothetical protein [Thermomicrobiales bacterium]
MSDIVRTIQSRRIARLIIALVLIALMVAPSVVMAQDATPIAPATSDSETVTMTPEPDATSTPEPETTVDSAIETETPSVDETPVVVTETPEAAAFETPAAVTPEPIVTTEAAPAELAIVSLAATGDASCTLESPSNLVTSSNPYLTFKCVWPGEAWRIRLDSMSRQWTYILYNGAGAMPNVNDQNAWQQNLNTCPHATAAGMSGASNAFYVLLKPMSTITAGSQGVIVARQLPNSADSPCLSQSTAPAGSVAASLIGFQGTIGSTLTCVPADPRPETNPAAQPGAGRYYCDAPANSGIVLHVDGLTPGWKFQFWAFENNAWRSKMGPQGDIGASIQHPNGNGNRWLIDLIPDTTAEHGSRGTIWLRVTADHYPGSNPASTYITLTKGGAVSPITADDLTLTCTPEAARAANGERATIQCAWSGKASLGSRSVVLGSISIPAPAGWQIATDAAGATITGQKLTISPNHTITSNAASAYTITFRLSPTCSAPPSALSFAVSSTLLDGSKAIDGPARTLTAARTEGIGSLTVSLLDTTGLDWTTNYAFDDQMLAGNLAVQVDSNRCGAWNVQISATDFTYAGSPNGANIPSGNITVDGIGNLATPLTILNASGAGEHPLVLDLTVTVPGSAPPGVYTSNITLTAASGP